MDHQNQWIVSEARKRSPADRDVFLTGACRGDPTLRAKVEALLSAEGWLHLGPPFPDAEPTLIASAATTEGPGSVIGRYRILEKVGKGRFGVVYVAEQKEPVKRRVALKVIKLGMDTRQVVARFEAERQALALMDHPNIPRVLDAGANQTGRPLLCDGTGPRHSDH